MEPEDLVPGGSGSGLAFQAMKDILFHRLSKKYE
jgi:hypothetical protein